MRKLLLLTLCGLVLVAGIAVAEDDDGQGDLVFYDAEGNPIPYTCSDSSGLTVVRLVVETSLSGIVVLYPEGKCPETTSTSAP